jgi:MFS family permease
MYVLQEGLVTCFQGNKGQHINCFLLFLRRLAWRKVQHAPRTHALCTHFEVCPFFLRDLAGVRQGSRRHLVAPGGQPSGHVVSRRRRRSAVALLSRTHCSFRKTQLSHLFRRFERAKKKAMKSYVACLFALWVNVNGPAMAFGASLQPRGATIKKARPYFPSVRRMTVEVSTEKNDVEELLLKANSNKYTASEKLPEAAEEKKTLTKELTEPEEKKKETWLASIDGICYVSYLINVMVLSLPVVLLPLAATEQVALGQHATTVSAVVAGVSSVATLGGAVGKFVNGFICQSFGSYACSKWYLAGLGLCSLGFSLSSHPTQLGLFFAGMEFFASIQWASLAVMLTNYYEMAPPVKLAAALTALGLSSTSGQILAKTVGVALASALHWRTTAQLGAVMALVGALVISRAPKQPHKELKPVALVEKVNKKGSWMSAVGASLKALLANKLFWMLALAHSMAFVARGTDRILGTFFHEFASLPHSISGGLTLSITLGLVYGLVTGSKQFAGLAHCQTSQRRFLAKRYVLNVAATLGLTALAATGGTLGNKIVLAAAVALLSGTLASNIAFQYFQFPSMIAKLFGEHKAVCISFLDGFGFLLSAPIFAATAKLVPSLGWSSTWGLLAVLFGAAGALMLYAIAPVLEADKLATAEA